MKPGETNTERLWTRSRRAAYAEITDIAMGLFLSKGFDATTIDDIASASGISRRSFFRYFGTKEDIVLGDLTQEGEEARRALEERPDSEPPWAALRNVLLSVTGESRDRERMLKVTRMMYETPSLRSRCIEKHLQWQTQMTPEVRRRLARGHTDGPWLDVRAQSLVACAIACLDVAGEAWARADGRVALGELLESAFDAVGDTCEP
ncbi:TetR/AcrR family transcriptional regulator [Nocardiopsis sp. EMB25]|uniref:TetR family transcriptional regulator n=1 Tax=Nocardiopsis TaxID=2013 RepID=UPI00034B9304|nr:MULTISPECIES: TetR family transcriptional regulator [Nocardiopsis]MCY9784275.1 TetR/AcrR family transcriptional regulator [Nocardiopsis sp. EMB25]